MTKRNLITRFVMSRIFFRCYFVFALIAFIPGNVSAVLSASTIQFSPATVRNNLEITINFSSDRALTTTDPIVVYLPGLSRGTCQNAAGTDISDSSQSLLYPDNDWSMLWNEGTVTNQFHDSSLTLTPRGVIPANTISTVIIDKSNLIKANCQTTNVAGSPVFSIKDSTEGSSVVVDYSDRTTILGSCYFTDTQLIVRPQLPKRAAEITFSFRPAMSILAGESVTINMPGFTNSDFTGSSPAGIGKGGLSSSIVIDSESANKFEAFWTEGLHVSGLPGFTDSSVTFTVKAGEVLLPGTLYIITVDRYTNRIGSQCSMAQDNPLITIQSNASLGEATASPLEHSDSVGNLCKHAKYCNNNGSCDVCTESCICDKGYHAADCSSLYCPTSYAWGMLPSVDGSAHYLQECSASGICDRATGSCKCFKGFGGAACDRRSCPSFEGDVCSGRGTCLSQRQLSQMPDALPLSDPQNFYTTGSRQDIYSGWDKDIMFRCHCDSSWSVGLGPGETQEPEFFGNACEKRHCPSGDDPMTIQDETNCTSIVAEGGKGVGLPGNLCHVECSNRGLCDHTTGICSCFSGFWGNACEMIKEYQF